ncbi:MAG: glycosyltransferase family 2 protein [Clostridia bacterium]|nr:glycosyltransferase family 2 protein [Clostridia bacterium]
MEELISVIVTLYKTEEYAERCIQSIVDQTYKNIEIILVDDGSPDRCPKICDDYAKLDKRVKVIHKDNGGVSSARNEGLKSAKGLYVQFVDGDDYIDPDMCMSMIYEMESADSDLVICGYDQIVRGVPTARLFANISYEKIQDLSNNFSQLYSEGFINPVWNKLYKKHLIKSLFDESFKIGEDLLFNLQYLEVCKKTSIISSCLYYYCCENINSLTTLYGGKSFDVSIKIFLAVNSFYRTYFNEQYCFGAGKVFFVDAFFTMQQLVLRTDLNKKEKEKQIQIIVSEKHLKYVCKNSNIKNMQYRLVSRFILYQQPKMIYTFFHLKRFIKYILSGR